MEARQADKIADALEEMVFTGQFEDGQRLDESTLATRFGVSRTPVREALQRLVSSHLAKQIPRRGVFVQQPTCDMLVEMFETMAEVEGVCVHLAAQRITGEGLDKLNALNECCMHYMAENDPVNYCRYNEEFHHLIYNLSGNSFLENEARRLYERLKPFRRVRLLTEGRMAQSLSEHNELITALTKGKAEKARKVMLDHIAPLGLRFYAQMEQLDCAPLHQEKAAG